ncbi:hydroxymethylglutaryl-CoA lyase [Virgibacillus sp. NKC19-3]|uniref:hydroxymethylglutaryl-CoA lyase n=1 Tax=Virgibacillus saliphilus TaxID=2831674 RepID=UPI001C9B93E2|nr:hydroxymethylglutaryl-CoA lyase [Virgibacillus sp. NKC19-3]MBY7144305.1 hydroxymethylglutaryl-CoA lyase [Virgibacillus sp. NKC19-3]
MERIFIQEVAPRDGLQNEDAFIPTPKKIELINQLSNAGVDKMEVTSFVSPKAVPNLRDAEEVMKMIKRNTDVTYTALIPNLKGAKRAVSCNVDEVNLLVSASNTHNLKNVGRSTEETFEGFRETISFLEDKRVLINGSIGTSFGCPFEGSIPERRVLSLIEKYRELGANGITLADTTGMATPKQVYELCKKVISRFHDLDVTLHFHNTRGMGLANVIEGIRAGVTRFDASLGGVGGCPFAPGATGNICTEDLVHMLQFMDYELNANLDKLLDASHYLGKLLSHDLPGQVAKAGKITDLHDASNF